MAHQHGGKVAEVAERRRAADAAAGRVAADIVLSGGRIVDVLSGRLLPGDLAIAGARIAAIGDVTHCIGPTTEKIDYAGRFILPGFIDPHFHTGFSQVTIERLAELIVPQGTVALSTCFYESAAIGGLRAVEEQLERAKGTGLDVLLSPFHASALNLGEFGCTRRFSLEDMKALLDRPECVELREWSDAVRQLPVPGIAETWEHAIRRGHVIGGHLEGLSGAALQAAAAQGVCSDHEAITPEEALERVKLGIYVQMREGSSTQDMVRLLPAITEQGANPALFSVCSDEQELHDLADDGHLDGKLRTLVRHGLAPIDAVRLVTLNAARSLGVERDYGAVTPGRFASLVVVDNLADFNVLATFAKGKLAARDGQYLLERSTRPYPEAFTGTVKLGRTFRAEDFALPIKDGAARLRAIHMRPSYLETRELHLDLEIARGSVVGGPARDIAKLAVADRHEASGRLSVALTHGFGVRRGAFAATINAGIMNLFVMGVDDADMALAANRIAELDGGIVVVEGGEVVAELPMPVLGILSHAPLEDSLAAMRGVANALKTRIGSPHKGLVPMAGFACLAVSIPELKLTDRGLVRVERSGARRYVPLLVGDAPASHALQAV
ncbi:adenine deaminase C-terminal domain-containing protein [Rhodoligotrophos defluvii]|uniref:adenine deaminase C-terminal domain-containing protein n=1 Tax=Rhodoligotrophos defluvii TaxID=2561934 RepID=UPI0010C98CDF|nr:adenine deaminase C-terminal domain-containing protein [Rhodoligotrophos defluvii]